MNEERIERLEGELRALRPVGVSARAVGGIARELEERVSVWDRVLVGMMGVGAVAACLIVGVVVYFAALESPGGRQGVVSRDVPTLANPAAVLARAEFSGGN